MPVYNRKVTKGLLWFYQFYLNGKTYKSKTIYDSKQEAKQAESKAYQDAIHHQKHPEQLQDIEMKKAIDERLDYIKVRKSKSYYDDSKRYLSTLYHTYNFVGEVRKSDIERILQEQVQRGSYVTNAILRAFKAFFNYTIQNYDLDIKNPCQYIKPFGVEKRIKLIPSDNDIESLLKVCTAEQKFLIEFMIEKTLLKKKLSKLK